jgi:hypothetical protein
MSSVDDDPFASIDAIDEPVDEGSDAESDDAHGDVTDDDVDNKSSEDKSSPEDYIDLTRIAWHSTQHYKTHKRSYLRKNRNKVRTHTYTITQTHTHPTVCCCFHM